MNGANGEGGANGTSGDGGGAPTGAPQDSTTYASGTRIKARVQTTTVTAPDGAKLSRSTWAGWIDTTRNEACDVGTLSDAKSRCVPTSVGRPFTLGAAYFTEATCTTPLPPLISVPGPTTSCDGTVTPQVLPKYILTNDPGTCIQRLRPMVQVTAPATIFLKSGANCLNAGVPPVTDVFVDVAQAEIAPSTFAEMTSTTTTN